MPTSGRPRRILRDAASRLVPGELFALGAAVATLLALRAAGLHYGWNTIVYFFPQQFRLLPYLFAWGVGLQIVATVLRRAALRDYLRAVLQPLWLARWLRAWMAAILVAYAYVWLKISVPLVRTALYDPQLWRLDRWMHFGISPSVFAITLAAGTPLAHWLDVWYAFWLYSFGLMFTYVLAEAREGVRRHFVLASGVLWVVGAVLYVAFPAIGPCYASPDILEPVRAAIPNAVVTQKALWANYLSMVRGREGVLPSFNPLLGVAAMPSLHVGSHWFFALWSRRHEPRLFWFFALATALTFFGSLVTAWHYAVDGYAGMLLGWFSVRVADRFAPSASIAAA